MHKINNYASDGIPFLFITDFEGGRSVVLTPEEAFINRILYDLEGFMNFRETGENEEEFSFRSYPVSEEIYRKAFDNVSRHLKRGNTYLVNLTFPTILETSLTLKKIFLRSKARFRLLFRDEFTLFSPEPFISVKDGIIRSNPMKGTIDASVPDAENILLNNEKEIFEHNTIVDLIRNDLSMVSEKVAVRRFRYIEKIRTNRKDLLQMSSEIEGRLPADWRSRFGNILFSLLPSGSISGAPKEKTVEIIRETEPVPRGFYTGVFGVFNGRDVTSSVMIRFIEKKEDHLYFRSGGGITALSSCEDEYRELIDKVYVPFI